MKEQLKDQENIENQDNQYLAFFVIPIVLLIIVIIASFMGDLSPKINNFINDAIIFFVGIIIILLIRKVNLWYWGISKIHSQNDEIISLLKKLNDHDKIG